MDDVNFSENLRIAALKLLTLTQFASPNQSIYFNFEHDGLGAVNRSWSAVNRRWPPTGLQKTEANHIILHYKNNTIFHNL